MPVSLLSVTNVTVRLGRRRVLSGIDFAVGAEEMIGLIGPNGSGKTSLLRVLANLQAVETGEVRLEDRPILEIDRRTLARHLAYLPQDGISHWPVSVTDLVSIGRLPHRESWREPSARDRRIVAASMEAMDVGHLAHRSMTRLSGGERARVLLARALAVEPRALLADEPVAGLDPYHGLEVMERLHSLAEAGAGVVVVFHDLALAARFCHRLVLLDAGHVVASGPPAEVVCAENLARVYRVRAVHGRIGDTIYTLPWERLPTSRADTGEGG